MDSTLLVLQHIECEPPAAFEDELCSRGLDLVRVELDEGDSLPDWREFAATIVMGGPMGAYEEDAHPWLVEEKRQIGEAARAGHPVWGVCLGAQLLAGALGARVYPGHEPEVGLLPVELTATAAEDPVFNGAPSQFPTLQWHGDSFDLPERRDAAGRLAGLPEPGLSIRALLRAAVPSRGDARARGPSGARCRPTPRASRRSGAPARSTAWSARWARTRGSTIPLARGLFGRWLERVVRVPARAIG